MLSDLTDDVPDAPRRLLLSPSWRSVPAAECKPRPQDDAGHVVYRLASTGELFRIAAREGAQPENLSKALDRLSPGADLYANTSPSGDWLVIRTTRFGCADECLAVVSGDMCRAQIVFSGADAAPASAAVVSSDGSLVVYADEGPHARDLFAIRRVGDRFGDPVLLTKASPYAWNEQPALSDDGSRVLFDCGNDAGGGPGTSICEVSTQGVGFHVVIPGGEASAHHADYAPDGTVVFEGTWSEGGAEQIWLAHHAGEESKLLHEDKDEDGQAIYADDNSPCVLPNGRIVSLWMGRRGSGEGQNSGHEPLVSDATGKKAFVLLPGVDVADIGLSCSR
jgi:hypothetical protein